MKRWLVTGGVLCLCWLTTAAVSASYLEEALQGLQNDSVYISPDADASPGVQARIEGQIQPHDYLAVAILPESALTETDDSIATFTRQLGEELGRDAILVVAAGDQVEAQSTSILPPGKAHELVTQAKTRGHTTIGTIIDFITAVHQYQAAASQPAPAPSRSRLQSWPVWGLIGLGLLALMGGALLLTRRRQPPVNPPRPQMAPPPLGHPAVSTRPHVPTVTAPAATVGSDTAEHTGRTRPLRAVDPRRIGRYTVRARLGEGGMGQVFLGQSQGGRLVAIKVVASQFADDQEFRQRFLSEIQAVRRVNSIHTASFADADPYAEQPWLATEYINAPNLQEVIRPHPLGNDLASLVGLMAGLAEALQAIHGQDIIHRDLKPSNILCPAGDGIRVIDFGIAHAIDATRLTGGEFIGSAPYASPEHAQGLAVGPPSDVFSLGSVMVFAATGEPPFGRHNLPAVLVKVVTDQPNLSGVPTPIFDLVAQCLHKDPVRRPTPHQILAWLSQLSTD